MEELRRIEELKRTILQKILSSEARARLSRVKMVKPEFANQVELYLIQLYQAGKVKGQISDEQLKRILQTLTSQRRFRIVRK
jgi:programmed cell death protein 5